MRYRKKQWPLVLFGSLLAAAVTFGLIFLFSAIFGPGKPEDAVQQFYEYEQQGNYDKAWELFHPEMQSRFNKEDYGKAREEVYNVYNASSFKFELADPEKEKNWSMTEKGKTFSEAYRIEATQQFKSKWGRFSVVQDVYAVKENDEWKILWEYE